MSLPRLVPKRRDGSEPFVLDGDPASVTVLEFWRWSASDLVSNATRGRLAEFIVAMALGVPTDGVRDEWAPYDLLTPEGIQVEVKASGYVQSWAQERLSKASFGIRPTRAYDAEAGRFAEEAMHQADVYVFALLFHEDKDSADPLNLEQWEFYVAPTTTLASMVPLQKSISLASLQRMKTGPVGFRDLRGAVLAARNNAAHE
jgi:hypothetical protein